MEPVSTSAMVGAVVGYLASLVKEDKSVKEFLGQFSTATINWIKPIFFEEEEPKSDFKDFLNHPEDELNIEYVKNAINRGLRQNNSEIHLREIYTSLNSVLKKYNNTFDIRGNKNIIISGSSESTIKINN